MPMLVEFEPQTVRVPPILLHSAGAAEVGFGSSGFDRSMSGLARRADLRNFLQGRKSATGRAEELRAQRPCDVRTARSESMTMVRLTEPTTVATASHARYPRSDACTTAGSPQDAPASATQDAQPAHPQPLHQCLNRRSLEQAADRKLNIQRRTDPADGTMTCDHLHGRMRAHARASLKSKG